MNVLKSIMFVFALVFTASLSSTAQTAVAAATSEETYYLGTWDVLVKGTPNGDAVIPVTIEKKDGKLVGKIVNPESKEDVPCTTVEITGSELTVAFSMMGYDLTMVLSKKDEDHANGKLMDMFDCEATRKKM